jgi:hypothetical protein
MLSVLSLTVFLAGDAAAQTGPAGTWEESTNSGLNAALNLTATDAPNPVPPLVTTKIGVIAPFLGRHERMRRVRFSCACSTSSGTARP